MNGRWNILFGDQARVYGEWKPGDAGPVPVVPVDEDAIARAARAYDEHRWPELGWHPDTDTFAVYFLDENRTSVFKVVDGYASIEAAGADIGRLVAVAVLRAAGETS